MAEWNQEQVDAVRKAAEKYGRGPLGAHCVAEIISAALATRQPVSAGSTEDAREFAAWTKWHGGLPLDPVGNDLATDDGLALPTFADGRTEIAWRAWAASNARNPAQPVSALTDEQIIGICEENCGWLAGALDAEIIKFARALLAASPKVEPTRDDLWGALLDATDAYLKAEVDPTIMIGRNDGQTFLALGTKAAIAMMCDGRSGAQRDRDEATKVEQVITAESYTAAKDELKYWKKKAVDAGLCDASKVEPIETSLAYMQGFNAGLLAASNAVVERAHPSDEIFVCNAVEAIEGLKQ